MAVYLSPIGNAQQWFTNAGIPLSGGKLYTYAAGTTTPTATYTDNTGGTPNANPIILDSTGRYAQEIWFTGGQAYKFVVQDASSNTIGTYDQLYGISDPSVSGGTFSGTVSIKNYGAVCDGVTDDAAKIQAAVNSGFLTITIPSGISTAVGSKVTIPSGVTLMALGNAFVNKIANTDMFDLSGNNSKLQGLYLNGQGGTYTGRGVVITGGVQQEVSHCLFVNMASYCVEFTVPDAGASSRWTNCYFSSQSAPSQPCIKMPGTVDTAGNRWFIGCNAPGQTFIDMAASINTMVSSCAFTQLSFSLSTSSRWIVTSNRIAALGGAVTLDGTFGVFAGNDIAGSVVANTTCQSSTIGPNTLSLPGQITDNNTSNGDFINVVWDSRAVVTPVWGSSGTAPVIGNGSLGGEVTRTGRFLQLTVALGIGTTTTMGTGNWYFAAPSPFAQFKNRNPGVVGSWYAIHAGAYYTGPCIMGSGTNQISLLYNANGSPLGVTNPFTWASTDTIYVNVTFEIGG